MTTILGQPPIDFDAAGARWTAREIAQQPALWREVARTVASVGAETDAFLRPLLDISDLRIVLTGAGTSAFAGEVLAPYLARATGRRVEAIATTDLVSNPRLNFAENVPTLLVSFARSGDSPESVAATRLADQCLTRCHHLVLTCNSGGELYRDHSGAPRSLVRVMPTAANDRSFAMTSSYTCMLLTALLVLGADQGDDLAERLATSAERLLATSAAEIRAVAHRPYRRIVYLGSGPLKGIARESALKMLELSAGTIATWYDSPLGFRHGPKSVLDDTTLVLVFISTDPYTRKYDLDIVAELRATLAPGAVVAVTAHPDDHDGNNTWTIDGVQDVDDAAISLPFVLCAQLLALYMSIALGHTPDNPFPAGEVNRVVQGVTIHPLEGLAQQ
ncbi:SIS domain-containing protein [Nakamurella sp. PAMC28650]|uniref:SIS domain-containing protein n=1 Tax=Nakamurella sp. PAMC28650 TaxID=2762325 RepID=UPI00164EC5F3|nr:SIS domain-containing protein [Nakamurella sp. PAMC28650]QNK81568.1 SIS domain-containing protein [Nakamurella sp. PAMC28650]